MYSNVETIRHTFVLTRTTDTRTYTLTSPPYLLGTYSATHLLQHLFLWVLLPLPLPAPDVCGANSGSGVRAETRFVLSISGSIREQSGERRRAGPIANKDQAVQMAEADIIIGKWH